MYVKVGIENSSITKDNHKVFDVFDVKLGYENLKTEGLLINVADWTISVKACRCYT